MKFNTYSIIAVCRETGCMGGRSSLLFSGAGGVFPFHQNLTRDHELPKDG